MIRRQHPVLKQQQIPDVNKPTRWQRQKEKDNIKKELGIEVDSSVQYANNPKAHYTNFTPEVKEKRQQAVIKSVAARKLRDKTFKRKQNREVNAAVSKGKGRVKTCTICGETKGIGAFDLMRTKDRKLRTYRPYCYKCRKKKNQEYYQKNKEKWEHINDHRRISE